jgi:hypothetical protein
VLPTLQTLRTLLTSAARTGATNANIKRSRASKLEMSRFIGVTPRDHMRCFCFEMHDAPPHGASAKV